MPAGAADVGAPDAAAGEREAGGLGTRGRRSGGGSGGRAGRGAEGFIKESSDKSARSSVQQLQKKGGQLAGSAGGLLPWTKATDLRQHAGGELANGRLVRLHGLLRIARGDGGHRLQIGSLRTRQGAISAPRRRQRWPACRLKPPAGRGKHPIPGGWAGALHPAPGRPPGPSSSTWLACSSRSVTAKAAPSAKSAACTGAAARQACDVCTQRRSTSCHWVSAACTAALRRTRRLSSASAHEHHHRNQDPEQGGRPHTGHKQGNARPWRAMAPIAKAQRKEKDGSNKKRSRPT